MNVRRVLPRLALAVLLAAAVLWAVSRRQDLDVAAIETAIRGMGFWAPLAYMALYGVAAVLFLPGSILSLAAGALFGPVWGAAYALIGATLGATLAFLIARYLASDWVAAKAGGRLKQLIEGVEAEGWRFVAFVRLVPLFPFNLLNYALGLTKIRLRDYVLASLVCMAPGAVAYTYLGYAGREALAGNEAAVRYGLIALALLAVVAFLPRLVRRLRGDRAPRWIELDDLARRLEDGTGIAVIDVRGPDEFIGPLGHIGTALNLPVGELPDRLIEINALKDQPVILVCRTDKRSATAAALLRDAGFRDARVLRGGMEQWNRNGLPVEDRNIPG
jgi:uncharacterized membrane protein YdjX (TVP38/TMEM64 family)/rhodanese-related sulfurtransferase